MSWLDKVQKTDIKEEEKEKEKNYIKFVSCSLYCFACSAVTLK